MSDTTATQSLAAMLPFELLDMIFRIVRRLPDTTYRYYGTRTVYGDLALVCQSWRSPAQRLLYRTGVVGTYVSWDWCYDTLSANAQLATCVQSIRFTSQSYNSKKFWDVDDLSTFLQLLPRLTTLHLELSCQAGSPGYKGDYSELIDLPNLTHLALTSDNFDKDLMSYRDILSHTPNLISLSLGNTRSLSSAPPTRKRIARVSLPSLTKLTLSGDQLCRLFDKLKLFTDETMENIVDLEFSNSYHWSAIKNIRKYSASSFLEQIGPQLRTLRLSQGGAGGLIQKEILEYCPNLTTLVGPERTTLDFTPASVRTIEMKDQQYGAWSVDAILKDKPTYFKNVTTLKIHSFRAEGI